MGKRTDAIIYYCDMCKKAVIGEGRIIKNAEYMGVAHGLIADAPIPEEISFIPTEINKFIVPNIRLESEGYNPVTGTCNGVLEVKSNTKYLCKECAEKIISQYTEYCEKIEQLFEKSNVSKTSM